MQMTAFCIDKLTLLLKQLRILQNDLLKLEEWENKWKMLVNINKCMILRVTVKRRPLHDYKLPVA